MDTEEKKKMLGMNQGGGTGVWKLNKVEMSGDTGKCRLVDLATEREKGTKANIEELDDTLQGVILKMRWHLTRYEESGSLSSTEYDDKWKDQVTVYPMKDKGSVETMKAKYKLSTNRIIYFYVPAKKEIVRLVVKASGLSGDKNPNKELGLFEYIDEFAQTESLPCDFITICKGIFREGTNADGSKNKRKDHYAMSFSTGRQLTETEMEKIQTLMVEVNEKVHAPKVEEDPMDRQDKAMDEALTPATPEIDDQSIP